MKNYPQYFLDEVEDFIMDQLQKRLKNDLILSESAQCDKLGFLPKVMHFCANSAKAFQKLQTILLTYAEEADYDNRLVNLFSDLIFKIHLACRLE